MKIILSILGFLFDFDNIVLWVLVPAVLVALGIFCGLSWGYFVTVLGLWYGFLMLVRWISGKIGKSIASKIFKHSDTSK